jgi:hypothetical protein
MRSVAHGLITRQSRRLPPGILADLGQIVEALNGDGLCLLPPALRQRLGDAWHATVEGFDAAADGANLEQAEQRALVPLLDTFRAMRGADGVVVTLDDGGRLTLGTRRPDTEAAACVARVLDFAATIGTRLAVLDRVRLCARSGCDAWFLTPERNASYCTEVCKKGARRTAARTAMRTKREQQRAEDRAAGLHARPWRCVDPRLGTHTGRHERRRILIEEHGEPAPHADRVVDWEVKRLARSATA